MPKLLIDNFTSLEEKPFIQIFKELITSEIELIKKSVEILIILIKPALVTSDQGFFKDIYDEILSFYIEKLMVPVINTENLESVTEILEILTHCLANDTFNIRFFFISKNITTILNNLIKHSPTEIKISAIKVLKSIISRKDTFLINNMIKSECISLVFDTFMINNATENLFFSCVLSLIVELKQNRFKPLQTYVSNLLLRYNNAILNSFFNIEKEREPIDIKRPRTISFDLTSQENFYDLDTSYNDFDLICLGKRSNEDFDEPIKKFKKDNE